MAKASKPKKEAKPIEQYEHTDKKRLNNPPVGLVDAHSDNGGFKKKTYQFDPHLDPQLQWAGKADHTSFEVPTVSLHVHERIDSRKIIETVKKNIPNPQLSLFEEHKKPLREAIEFYKHKENWSNRLIAGDSLLVMNSLLEKEGMGGKVQMVYFDPPYGIKYGSNFQPFVNKRDVKDGKDDDLTAEPEMLKAFRDTWELGIHSYLSYLRDRLILARDLLHESGSIFVQISDENVHRIRLIMDEIFGANNFASFITFQKTTSSTGDKLSSISDYLLWYAKDLPKMKYNQLFLKKEIGAAGSLGYNRVLLANGTKRNLSKEEKRDFSILPKDAKVYKIDNLTSTRPAGEGDVKEFEFEGKIYGPGKGTFKTDFNGLTQLVKNGRIESTSGGIYYVRYFEDFPYIAFSNLWDDTSAGGFGMDKIYVVQTNTKVVERCLLMTTDPGDLVIDLTCGSGTTSYVAENRGRRWITCDTSRVAITLAKQRLLTATFNYFELSFPNEGIGSGLKYESVKHKTLGSIANNQSPPLEILYDQPISDINRTRVSGPFTVEAVPAPVAKSFEEVQSEYGLEADVSIGRSGETLRQSEWRDELLRTGVRTKGGKKIEFIRVEPLSGTRYLQCEAETKDDAKRVVVCFGPEHAPLEQRTVELSLEEANHLKPKPQIILFCAFQFDEEAAKDIDETNWPGVTLLKAQMNADMLTDDLKKKRSSNESFWLIGQPDVIMKPAGEKGKSVVEVLGFDYYNPKTGTVEGGGKSDIAMWMLDTDYDGRSIFPTQVFFPMAGAKDGWTTLAKNLKAEIDEEKIEAFRGTESLPFIPGKAVAVKIIDARGIECLKILRP